MISLVTSPPSARPWVSRMTNPTSGPIPAAGARLALWRPGTEQIAMSNRRAFRLAQSVPSAAVERLTYTVPRGRGGWYYVQAVQTRPGAGAYTLTLARR